MSTPCILLLGAGHFLGGQGTGAKPVLFSGISSAELLLFWPQKSILMVPGWSLIPESPQPWAGTLSLPLQPSPDLCSILC